MNLHKKEEFDTVIILPAFNEEKNLPPLIENIRNKIPCAEIVVVDDGSADRTARAAVKAGAMAIRLPFNLG
ncbi:MAG TPA: glycosyl transferase family 2, partial [Nitrospiraceae bacterium]|nr:glycosyl transferase family 2 [Nitrospiraceae bacterium]